ncbi:NADH:ubiquinone oxidoreductase subunit NDUFA12 [Roseomonas sp. BN140053]|uniref:NADH:ubiquinone oxidoreductase subunit NDUFA12 n=1 Tax=Roseomonas sp. BN140053 TaxID=3391898 RepID=UPI0039E77AEE
MPFLMRLLSGLKGRRVGTDRFGNIYFETRNVQPGFGHTRRWVVYAGTAEATNVPPEWHGWLHHATETPQDENHRYPWQLEHRPNATGTALAYRPSGHDYEGGERKRTAGDYEAWTPGS